MPQMTRDDLLALTPSVYLADGFTDAAGRPRSELRSVFATAATTQLLAADAPPQEVGFTLEATQLLLPQMDDGPPAERVQAAVEEALETVARSIQQRNNEGVVQWLNECIPHIRTEADLTAFMDHMATVARQYAILAAVLISSEPASSSG